MTLDIGIGVSDSTSDTQQVRYPQIATLTPLTQSLPNQEHGLEVPNCNWKRFT